MVVRRFRIGWFGMEKQQQWKKKKLKTSLYTKVWLATTLLRDGQSTFDNIGA